MKKAVVWVLLFSFCVPAFALVESGQVQYTGGTISSLSVGAMGKFDLNRPDSLVFSSGSATLNIPYANITKFHYEEKLARHLGVILTIAVVLVKHRQRRHFVEITYRDPDNKEQVALFEIAKTDVDATKATIETRSPQIFCQRENKCRK